jgi:hypothetical protein
MQTCAQASGALISSTDNTICPGQSTQLVIPGASSTSYQWYLNDQAIVNANATTLSITNAGVYHVSVTNSLLGCADESDDFSVILNPVPAVSAGSDLTVCGGTQIALNASGANTYTWNNGAIGSSLFVNTVNQTYTSVYMVTGTDQTTGCSSTDQVSVSVNALPSVNAGADITACDNEEVTLSASGALNYSWSGSAVDGVPFQLSSGTTVFTVTGTDVNNCSASDDVQVTINPAPIVSAGSDVSVCPTEVPVLLSATSDQPSTTFVWNGSENSSDIEADQSGIYTVEGTNEFGCASLATVELTVYPVVTVQAGDLISACSDELPTELVATASAQVVSYNWSNGESTQAIEVSTAGTIQVTVTDLNGCESSDEVTVSVFQSPTVNAGADQTLCESELPATLNATGTGGTVEWSNGALSPVTEVNDAGLYTVTVTSSNGCQAMDEVEVIVESCLSIAENESSMRLYPNPATDQITVESSESMYGTYRLYAFDGKLFSSGTINGENSLVIQLDTLSKGVYMILLDLESRTKEYRIEKL